MSTEKKSLPKRWTPEEEQKLLKLVKLKKSPEEIAEALGRTVGGPVIRLNKIAVRMVQGGKSRADAISATKVTEEQLEKQLKFADNRAEKDSEKTSPVPDTLTNIDKKLDLILARLTVRSE